MAGNGGDWSDVCLEEDVALFDLLEKPTECPQKDLHSAMKLCCRLLLEIHKESLIRTICFRLSDWDRTRAQELVQEFMVDVVFDTLKVQVGLLDAGSNKIPIERKWGSLLQWAQARLGRLHGHVDTRRGWGWLANRARVRRVLLPLGDDGSSIQGVDGDIAIKSDETRDPSNVSGERGDAPTGMISASDAAREVEDAEIELKTQLTAAAYNPFERFVIEVARASERIGVDAQSICRLAIHYGLLGRAKAYFQRTLIAEIRQIIKTRGVDRYAGSIDQVVLADLSNAEVHAVVSVFERRSLSCVQKVLAKARKAGWWCT